MAKIHLSGDSSHNKQLVSNVYSEGLNKFRNHVRDDCVLRKPSRFRWGSPNDADSAMEEVGEVTAEPET